MSLFLSIDRFEPRSSFSIPAAGNFSDAVVIMLEPFKYALKSDYRLILASASPRRREILQQVCSLEGFFEVVPSKAEENLDKAAYADRPWQFAEDTADLKAKEVFQRLREDGNDEKKKRLLVIGADTVISFEGRIIGKPKSEEDAESTLKRLSGKSHQVYSGISLIIEENDDVERKKFHAVTRVNFDELSDDVIKGYVGTGEPMDKAGAYGIQALGGSLITGIEGDYYNVMGFPLNLFCRELRKTMLFRRN